VGQGHELGLHVLYQLFADHACSDLDQPISTSAAYDQFLLSLVCLCYTSAFEANAFLLYRVFIAGKLLEVNRLSDNYLYVAVTIRFLYQLESTESDL